MKIEVGKLYKTRGSLRGKPQKVRIAALDNPGKYPVRGAVLMHCGWVSHEWGTDGIGGSSVMDIVSNWEGTVLFKRKVTLYAYFTSLYALRFAKDVTHLDDSCVRVPNLDQEIEE